MELKFRSYNKETRKMMSWEFISKFKNLHKLIALNHVEVMQFTGFKDINGIDIYVGDIIKFHTGVEQRDSIQEKVCYNQGCFGFRSLKHDGVKVFSSFTPLISINKSLMDRDIFKDESEVLEVVGNVYEN